MSEICDIIYFWDESWGCAVMPIKPPRRTYTVFLNSTLYDIVMYGEVWLSADAIEEIINNCFLVLSQFCQYDSNCLFYNVPHI